MTRYCDIVMKGGITSGVVYPLAAVKLSERYTFKNVGGTSAGAIAAAAVAAAEHGRSGGGGTAFEELAELPDWLGANLTSVFQPSRATKPLFAIVLAATAGRSRLAKAGRGLGSAVRGFPLAVVLGALPGLLLAGASIAEGTGFLLVWGLVCATVLLAGGVAIALAGAIARRAAVAVPENGFGLVSGYRGQGDADAVPLTVWLTDLLDRVSGKSGGDALTFGDLWGSDPDEREVNLEMMTTCLTQGRPYRLPFADPEFWFDPDQMRALFPPRVVDQMIRDARPEEDASRFAPLVPLPEAADLPVVVAVRMSLSFPVLISAVPLHAIDHARPVAEEERRPEPCWFSDGGITSNFPVHFFDSPVPRWPTFAIDLRKLPGEWTPSDEECENVWMPPDNDSRGDEWWIGWEELPPRRRMIAFAGSIFRTMQNWVDQTQSHVHGYRDRVVHIEHSGTEGGLNLTMPEPVIRRLSTRGECAGDLLHRRFAVPPETDSPLTWENQRWIRYRSFMRLLEEALARLRRGCVEQLPGDRPIADLGRRPDDEPPGYRWESPEQREFALAATRALVELIEEWKEGEQSFAPGSPEPPPEIRIAPRI